MRKIILIIAIGCIVGNVTGQNMELPADKEICKSQIETCKYFEDSILYQPFSRYHFIFKTTVPPDHFREDFPDSTVKNSDTITFDLILKVLPTCFYDQREIRYEYHFKDSLFAFEHTGVLSEENVFTLKAPRYLLEESDYSFHFQIRPAKKKWTDYAIMANRNDRVSPKNTIYNRFKIELADKDTTHTVGSKSYICKNYDIYTKHRGRIRTNSQLIFSPKVGFVFADVNFENGNWYSLKLVDFTADFCEDVN